MQYDKPKKGQLPGANAQWGFGSLKRYYFLPISAVILSACLLLSSFKHEFHSSLAEVNYNPASKSLEVSLRVFSDDFGVALGKDNNRAAIKVDESTTHDALIKAYLNKHFALTDKKNVKKPLTWVGKEIAVDVTWLYFEIPVTEDVTGMKLLNSVLFESFDDQVNIVNFTYKGQKKTFLYKPSQSSQILE